MIWIITSGAGHHHSASLCGPKNQPVSQIKGAVRAAGELVGENHLKGSSQGVTRNGHERWFPKNNWPYNLWAGDKGNAEPPVKIPNNFKMVTAEH